MDEMTKDEKKPLAELIKEDKEKRLSEFKEYVQQGMKIYNCTIEPKIIITGKGVIPELMIEAL